MIILRVGDKKAYRFILNKKDVTDPEMIEYIKKLVIPPGYIDVKIFYQRVGQPKILFQGHDAKGRLQRIYSDEWNKKAVRKKFCELLNFASQIQRMRVSIKEQMLTEHHSKNKMVAMILSIVTVCYFRIGNKRYQELYGSFGAMNIHTQHVEFKKEKGKEYMSISFNGKKGILNTCNIYDGQLISEMKKLLKFRSEGEMIFQWNDNGVNVPVRAVDINAWLKKFDPVITSKDFRTYDANIFLIIFLRSQISPERLPPNKRKKIIVEAMKRISVDIHNTPAVLKKNYTAGGIISLYIEQPLKFKRYFLTDITPKQAFIGYLRDYCKKT